MDDLFARLDALLQRTDLSHELRDELGLLVAETKKRIELLQRSLAAVEAVPERRYGE